MSKRDYYEVLDVDRNVSEADLKKAYRRKSMKHHPDRNPGDAEAEKKFKESKEAYEVLSDSQKRGAYDQYGHAGVDPSMGAGPGAGGFGDSFSDIFGDIFGGAGGGGGRQRQRRGDDLRHDLKMTLEDAVRGKEVNISVRRHADCSTCDGSGAKKGSSPKTCGTCHGQGQVRMQQGFFAVQQSCPNCQGKGQIISDPCDSCRGSGQEQETKKLAVKIPAGVDNGDQIRLSGEGSSPQGGGVRGDVYVTVSVMPHEIFERDGVDLYCDVPIAYSTLTLGGDIEVPTLNGRAKLKIPQGSQSGKQFRLRGKGVSNVRAQGYVGDQYCRIQVETPVNLSKDQKDLLKKFDQSLLDGGSKHCPKNSSWGDKVKTFFEDII
jgi:molecular chaperone DnaJ